MTTLDGRHEDKYWYNEATGQVELGKQGNPMDLIGPFDTEADAANAHARLNERAREWADDDAERDEDL